MKQKTVFISFFFIFLTFMVSYANKYATSAISVDSGPLIRGLMRSGWGVGATFEQVIGDQLSLDCTLGYFNMVSHQLENIESQVGLRIYLNTPAPSGAYVGAYLLDINTWAMTSNGTMDYINTPGVNIALGYKYVFNEYQGPFFEVYVSFGVIWPIDSTGPTSSPGTWQDLGLRIGWAL